MNCAALHRSMGVNVSFVRSLSMDTWSEKKLKLMALGGNKKLKEFFQIYDLNDESVQQRYNTRAADFYRLKLRSMGENIPFDEQNPSYEIGREQVPQDEARSAEQIMQNNPPYQSDPNSSASDYLGTGMSYLQIAAQKAKDNATWAAEQANNQAKAAGID